MQERHCPQLQKMDNARDEQSITSREERQQCGLPELMMACIATSILERHVLLELEKPELRYQKTSHLPLTIQHMLELLLKAHCTE